MSTIQKAVELLGSQQKLAEAAGVSAQAVSFWVAGARMISPECAIKIEQATEGAVTRNHLRPDIFGPAPAAQETT